MNTEPEIDWYRLLSAARQVADMSYSPYSQVRVGAAALTDDGRVVIGCNVENVSLGLTTCAENGVASALASSGGGRIIALAVVAGDGDYLAPCGRCRQILSEFADPGMVIYTGTAKTTDPAWGTPSGARNTITLGELLPGAFTPRDYEARRG